MIDSLHCEFVDTIKSIPLIEYLGLVWIQLKTENTVTK